MADLAVTPPVEPVVTPPASDNDEVEWDNVHNELYPQLKPEDKSESTEKKPAPKEDTENKKQDEELGTGDDTKPNSGTKGDAPVDGEKPAPEGTDTSIRDSRLTARKAEAELDAIRADIRTALYPDAKETLVDKEGDPITSIEDVMKLVNPRTEEAFTEEEAGMWLLSAQQRFNETKAAQKERVDKVADVTTDLKDQADVINSKYSELLKDKDLKNALWNMYEKTLVKENDIIVDAPVSLGEFYEMYLAPRAEQATVVAEKEAETAAQVEADKKAAEQARDKKRSDRSDVYKTGKDSVDEDPEEDEWEAAKSVQYGKRR